MLLNIRALVAEKHYEDRRRMCQAALAPFFKPDGGRHPQPRHSVRCGGVFASTNANVNLNANIAFAHLAARLDA
jgi:hypothetical protein